MAWARAPTDVGAQFVQAFMGQRLGQFLALHVHHQPQRRYRQVPGQLQRLRRRAMHREQRLQQQGTWRQRFHAQAGQGRLAQTGTGDRVHHSGHHRVFPAHECQILPLQRLGAAPGYGQAIVRQALDVAGLVLFSGPQHIGVVAVFLNVDAQNVEGLQHVVTHPGPGFFLLDGGDQPIGHLTAAGVQLDQGIPAVLQHRLQTPGFMGGSLDQRRQRTGVAGQGLLPGLAHRGHHRHADGTAFLECPQPVLEPAVLHFLAGAFQIGDVDLDGLGLADAVQAPNPLFQQIRVLWQGRTAPSGGRTGSCAPRCRSPSRSAPGHPARGRRNRRRRDPAPPG